MPRHAACDGMDREPHIHSALAESVIEFPHFVLGLRDGHAISRNDDNLIRGGQYCGRFFRSGATHRLGFLSCYGGSLDLAEGPEQYVAE